MKELLLLLIFGLFTQSSYAEIYKCVQNGRISYVNTQECKNGTIQKLDIDANATEKTNATPKAAQNAETGILEKSTMPNKAKDSYSATLSEETALASTPNEDKYQSEDKKDYQMTTLLLIIFAALSWLVTISAFQKGGAWIAAGVLILLFVSLPLTGFSTFLISFGKFL